MWMADLAPIRHRAVPENRRIRAPVLRQGCDGREPGLIGHDVPLSSPPHAKRLGVRDLMRRVNSLARVVPNRRSPMGGVGVGF
jgi:hypothetical protein